MVNLSQTDYSLSAIRRWPTNRSKEWVSSFLEKAVEDLKVVAIIAVGSAVRDNVKSADIDLVLIARDSEKILQNRPPIEVDIRIFAAEEVELKVLKGHDYLGWAVKYGAVLHEKDSFWSKLVAKLGNEVPLPSAFAARERAALAQRFARELLEMGDEDAASEQLLSLLTHLARAELIDAGVYPASRPELPFQLKEIGQAKLANLFEKALNREHPSIDLINEIEALPSFILARKLKQ